jgi:hypothetical protein
VQPLRVPGFAFPWLELASHRALLPRLLGAGGAAAAAPAAAASAASLADGGSADAAAAATKPSTPSASPAASTAPSPSQAAAINLQQHGWAAAHRLLLASLRFQEPHLRRAELSDAARLMYKGTLRVLLCLLHDFPEFLCERAPGLCAAVPAPCVQLRNLLLSAFPRAMRLPDPFTPSLKVDLLPESGAPPRIRPLPGDLLPPPLRAELDAALAGRASAPAAAVSLLARLASPRELVGVAAANGGGAGKYDAGKGEASGHPFFFPRGRREMG